MRFPKCGQLARGSGIVRAIEKNCGRARQLFQAARPLHISNAGDYGIVGDRESARGEKASRSGRRKRVAHLKTSWERNLQRKWLGGMRRRGAHPMTSRRGAEYFDAPLGIDLDE